MSGVRRPPHRDRSMHGMPEAKSGVRFLAVEVSERGEGGVGCEVSSDGVVCRVEGVGQQIGGKFVKASSSRIGNGDEGPWLIMCGW